MRRDRDGIFTFSLSFLDAISCGFGAIVLLLVLTKIGEPVALEQARLDPRCDGYSFWTIVDVPPWAQGLLTQFWEPKASTPVFFRQFNGPTAILATLAPDSRIVAEGDTLRVKWALSHFGWQSVRDDTLAWRVEARDKRGGVRQIMVAGDAAYEQVDLDERIYRRVA